MTDRYIKTTSLNLGKRERIKDIGITLPQIRSELYVRLFSLLDTEPTVSEEGYEFFIKDIESGLEFSAGLTGFGPGYFAMDKTTEAKEVVTQFHEHLFNEFNDLKECKLEIENDYGKTILGYENGTLIEVDLEDE